MTGHLPLTFYSTTLKRTSKPFALDDEWNGLTNTRRVKSGLVAFADRTYFQLWKNDYLFFKNSAISKYYAILVPVMKKWLPFLQKFWYFSDVWVIWPLALMSGPRPPATIKVSTSSTSSYLKSMLNKFSIMNICNWFA